MCFQKAVGTEAPLGFCKNWIRSCFLSDLLSIKAQQLPSTLLLRRLSSTPHVSTAMKGTEEEQFVVQLLLEAVRGNSPAVSLWDRATKHSRVLTHRMCYRSENSKLVLWAISNSESIYCCQLCFSCESALRTSKILQSFSLYYFLVWAGIVTVTKMLRYQQQQG